MDFNQAMQTFTAIAIAFGLKILGAIVVWVVGRYLIGLAVRPYCRTDHYWQIYFDTNKVIRESFGAAGFPVPEQHLTIRNQTGSGVNP
jgi:small-conductance mechanosensitive channel